MFDLNTGIYLPSENEPYMNPRQLDYFRNRLLTWRRELAEKLSDSMNRIREFDNTICESVERGTREFDREFELQAQNRNWQLIQKIDGALDRISKGTYGYCEETEEPIGIKRLEASPVALYCLNVQAYYEDVEKNTGTRTCW